MNNKTDTRKSSLKVKKNKVCDVKFNNLTLGELLALYHALESYSEMSPVGYDVFSYLKSAIADSQDQKLIETCEVK